MPMAIPTRDGTYLWGPCRLNRNPNLALNPLVHNGLRLGSGLGFGRESALNQAPFDPVTERKVARDRSGCALEVVGGMG